MKRVVPLFIAITLITSVFVTAAGRSTGFNEEIPGTVTIAQDQDRNVPDEVIEQRKQRREQVINRRANEKIREHQTACERNEDRRDRIKCRLRQAVGDHTKGEDFSLLPEACRKIPSEQGRQRACVALYKRSAACYDREGEEKDKCFRRAIGYTKKTVKRASPEVKKEYLLLLLYELQERIEGSYDAGNIEEDAASVIIDLIVETKQKVLEGAPRGEIKSMTAQLRPLIKSARPTQEESA